LAWHQVLTQSKSIRVKYFIYLQLQYKRSTNYVTWNSKSRKTWVTGSAQNLGFRSFEASLCASEAADVLSWNTRHIIQSTRLDLGRTTMEAK
jgi:hypothetical protein